MTTTKDPYRTTYHRDGSVTIWDVYSQTWIRTSRPSDRILASLSPDERERVMRRCGIQPASRKYQEMVEAAEDAGQIYDELGESLCQPVLDEVGDRRWTGSREDWRLLVETALAMDAAT